MIPYLKLGLLGVPGSGKTTSALTFPGPRILSEDNKEPPGTDVVPFFDPAITAKWADKNSPYRAGPRSALINFLKTESIKLGADRTEIIDSWTTFMDSLEIWLEANKNTLFRSPKGDVDSFKVHAERLNWCVEVMQAIRALRCNIIIIAHEFPERDSEGRITGQVKPISRGQFGDRFSSYLNAYFRQTIIMEGGVPRYVWQVVPDQMFFPILPPGMDLKKYPGGLLRGKYIPATYDSILKCYDK